MPATRDNAWNIVCDNPDCPGHELAHDDPAGWLFVSSEVYGEPSTPHVYGSVACVAAHSTALEAAGLAW